MKRTAEALLLSLALCFAGGAADAAPPAVKPQPSNPWAALKITRRPLVRLPEMNPASLLGVRTSGKVALVLSRDGQGVKIDLATGKTTPGTVLNTAGKALLDFACLGDAALGLTSAGTLAGVVPANWPTRPVSACKLDISGGEALLSGGSNAYYLAPKATEAVLLAGNFLAMPMHDGFLWNMKRPGLRAWEVSLMDGFGNQMKKVFRFSPEFDPTGISFGPNGPDGELLISFFTGTARELALVGQNGRMFWRLPVNAPVCKRDLAWDHEGNLLILERDETGFVLNKISFAVPEG